MKTHANHLHIEHSSRAGFSATGSRRTGLIGAMSVLMVAVAAAWSPALLAASDNAKSAPEPDHHAVGLVRVVRDATGRYRSLSAAMEDGYVKATECVSGPSGGAMGVHYARFDLFGDGVSDPMHPEVLVYEPTRHGSMQLVAVEYNIFAGIWDAANPGVAPDWMGQSANYIGFPNRFALPDAIYELHVWAWKHNPAGMFANFNPQVTCEYYDPQG